jgi:uncharacterized Zn finger protein
MVHYAPKLEAAQQPPPLCPKCGSHRTEVVGRSSNGDTVILRCHACGERSRISSATAADEPLPAVAAKP